MPLRWRNLWWVLRSCVPSPRNGPGLRDIAQTDRTALRSNALMIDPEVFARLGTTNVHIAPGRRIIRSGDLLTATVIGVSGTVLVWSADEHLASISAPFALGQWACDTEGRARIDVFAQSDLEIILLPADHARPMALNDPELRALVAQTQRRFVTADGHQAADGNSC